MKSKILLVFFAVALFVLSSSNIYTIDTQNIQTRVIEGFEKPQEWEVKFSKFRSPVFNQRYVGYTHPDAQRRGQIQPEDSQSWISWFVARESDFSFLPDGLPPDVRGRTEKTIMGVRASFEIKGYNWIVVQPKKPVQLYGIVKSLDVWIWGAGYKYDIEFIVKDYRGFYHVLPAGTLDHYGWKNFRVRVPSYIPQKTKWLPKAKPLKFTRFKITAQPVAREDNFHVYFDYMQVQTDIYRERFSGDGLVKLNWKKRGVRGTGQRGSQAGNTQTQGNQQGSQNTTTPPPGGNQQPPAGNQ